MGNGYQRLMGEGDGDDGKSLGGDNSGQIRKQQRAIDLESRCAQASNGRDSEGCATPRNMDEIHRTSRYADLRGRTFR